MTDQRMPGRPASVGAAVSGQPRGIPAATVARLPVYLRTLHGLAEGGQDTASSDALAVAAGVNSAKLRKDLSYLGSYGTRGVGYDIALLIGQISRALGLTERRSVVIVGVGNLGHALAGYAGFSSRGFRIAGLLDADPVRIGELVGDVAIRPLADLEAVVAGCLPCIGVIATPAQAAQEVADRLVLAGVRSILNFAPCLLAVPVDVEVRKVDLALELQILSFHEQQRSAAGAFGAALGEVVNE